MTMEIAPVLAPSGRTREDSGDEMATKTRILVVDDEADIRETLDDYLKIHDFEVTVADGGEAVRQLIEDGAEIDVVLLDINMPGEDGLSLARFLRERADVGIIMLTAVGETVDRIVGLEMGADDYLVKPVDLRELLARIRAVTRRLQAEAEAEPAAGYGTEEIAFGRCRLNLDSRKLFDAERNEIPITSMEFDLLKAFADHPNRVLNRDQLLDLAHNRDWEPFDRSIDIRIMRLRKKIEPDPSKPQIIKTVRGVGYMFVNKPA